VYATDGVSIKRHVHGGEHSEGEYKKLRLFSDVKFLHLEMPGLPAREEYYQIKDGKGLVMVYADRPYLNY
jgi:hypothetical protein